MTDQDPANLPGGTEMDELVKQATDPFTPQGELRTICVNLAAELTRLSAALAEEQEAKRVLSTQLREARAALQPFADMADMYDWGCADDAPLGSGMNVGHARNARAALRDEQEAKRVLSTQLRELRALLLRFLEYYDDVPDDFYLVVPPYRDRHHGITLGHLRAALSAQGKVESEIEPSPRMLALEEIYCLARDYVDHYLQDEANDAEVCLSDEQHRMARALNDALNEYTKREPTEP